MAAAEKLKNKGEWTIGSYLLSMAAECAKESKRLPSAMKIIYPNETDIRPPCDNISQILNTATSNVSVSVFCMDSFYNANKSIGRDIRRITRILKNEKRVSPIFLETVTFEHLIKI